MPHDPNIFLSIGKTVKDEYGRLIGEIASFAVKPNGGTDYVYIKHADGRFMKYPAGSIKVEGSEVIYLSNIKYETALFCDQIPLIWRKDQALRELLEKKKISQEVYEDLHSSFEGALNQLKTEAQTLLEKINKEIERCNNEIKELNYALVHLEVEHEIGEVDEQSYQTAFSVIQECLKRANSEKADLEGIRNKLSNILLGETPTKAVVEETLEEAPAPTSPSLPEPPVVVYVKEADESNI
ncbi:MAG: CdvA-like protein [Candidatus Bathycorpusculaceae bacterium]